MTIAVIGQGFVGGSLTTVMSEHGETVYVYDKAGKVAPGGLTLVNRQNDNRPVSSIPEFVQSCENDTLFSGVYFICLPTPMYEDGDADLSIVEGALSEIANTHHSGDIPRIAVVKSTVPPGTTLSWNKKFNNNDLFVIFCPEFLTEANALDDMRNQTRIVLGGPRPYINVVKNIFSRTFPNVPLIKTSSTTAEMVKYVTNCFLATKVSFANEMAQICEKLDKRGLDIDYDKVVEYSKFDERLGNSHWTVPGPDGSRGWGGHCFPKDLNALMYLAKDLGVNATILNATWQKNLEVRPGKDRDWEKMWGRAVSKRENKDN